MALLITETNETVNYIAEAKEDGTGKNYFIEGVFMQSNIKNRNGRMYPKETLQKEMKRYNEEYVERKRAFGELGHPDGPVVNLDRVSHMIESLKMEGNDVLGRAKIVGTTNGNIVKTLLDDGAQLGVSSRGMGSLKEERDCKVVQSDFMLATAADIVADPSAPSAFVQGIMEGVEFWYDTDRKAWVAEQINNHIKTATAAEVEANKFRLLEHYIRSL